MVRNLTEDDATMQERFTIPRGALELNNTLSAKVPAAQSTGRTRKATRGRCVAPQGQAGSRRRGTVERKGYTTGERPPSTLIAQPVT
jgi:hypothetical protein